MKIIALKGHKNSGKTSSLKNLYQLLIKNSNYNISVPQKKIGNADDFYAEFTNKKTQNKVAIYSEGDSPKSIEKALKECDNLKGNDILVLACRTRGVALKILASYNPIYKIKSITYYDAKTQVYVNNSDAKIIESEIQKLDQ